MDESGFNTSMTRLRARAPRGQRAHGKVPRKRGKNQTLSASIILQGAMRESISIEGATDAELFEAYVEKFLAPSLREGQVVVLDGLGAHRTQRVRDLVEDRGGQPFVLAALLARPEPHRGGFQQDKGAREESRSSHPRSARRGHRRGYVRPHPGRRCGLVRPLWLPSAGSMLVYTAVNTAVRTVR